MRYFTSDTHYGHANIIGFCDRPYADVHHMNVDLVNRAAAVLGPDDELWHLGDVALGYLDSSLTNLARIPANVTLVAGNHDRCHPYNGKDTPVNKSVDSGLASIFWWCAD
jgi:calcineurin-like phosphoesterase family protein